MGEFLVCTYCGLSVANFKEKRKKKSYKRHCPCYSTVVYCDRVCQKKDWRRHEESCKYKLLQAHLELPDQLIKIVCHFAADD